MSNPSASSLPSIGGTKAMEPTPKPPATKPKPKAKTKPKPAAPKMTERSANFELSMIDGFTGYCTRRVDLKGMSRQQAEALRALLLGLESKGAKLENGRHVTTPAHAIQWVLEQLG